MDVFYFFKERTRFLRYFYDSAAAPFRETMRKIDAEEAPFDSPPYREYGEPPYLDEWFEASEAVEVLGRSCLSMLSASLNLYFRTWEQELSIRWEAGEREHAFRNGYLNGYRICFNAVLDQSWEDCPADLALVEQIALARNRDQHPDEIMIMLVTHACADIDKYPLPFFMSEFDQRRLDERDLEHGFLMDPSVDVSPEQLDLAITEAERLAFWLEERLLPFRYGQ
ncbi:MAG: hypothetical protein OXC26_02645 [Albidovulum sp.]|nr:hypothetical protein [Albidovulum sp.]